MLLLSKGTKKARRGRLFICTMVSSSVKKSESVECTVRYDKKTMHAHTITKFRELMVCLCVFPLFPKRILSL